MRLSTINNSCVYYIEFIAQFYVSGIVVFNVIFSTCQIGDVYLVAPYFFKRLGAVRLAAGWLSTQTICYTGTLKVYSEFDWIRYSSVAKLLNCAKTIAQFS